MTAALPGPAAEPEDEVEASRAPLMDHLVELRTRMVRSLVALVVLFIAAWYVAQPALEFLLLPLGEAATRHGRLVEDIEVVTTAPLELLFVKLRIAFLLALAAAFPYIAYQAYAFVAPGLYKNERQAVLPFLFVMPFLFVAGGAVVYYFVIPAFMDLSFSQEFSGELGRVSYLPKVKEYYGLSISLLTAFGLAFQLPVVMSLLAKAGVVSAQFLRKGRKYAFVIIIIVAAVMTPPDPFSLFFLSVPLYLLFESGIIATSMIESARKRREAAEARAEAEEARKEAEQQKSAGAT